MPNSNLTIGSLPGGRSSGNANGLIWGPTSSNKTWNNGGFSIAWKITQSGSNYTYEYTVTTTANTQLSHWNLPLSQFTDSGSSLESHWDSIFGATGTWTDTGLAAPPNLGFQANNSGNPGMPSGFYGVKFTRDADVTQTVATFTTTQAPIWGDFYARDGSSGGPTGSIIHAYNAGFGTGPTSSTVNFTNWIPRPNGNDTPIDPDGEPTVPEPTSLAVFSLLAMVGAAGYWRSNKAQCRAA